jgi:hypothetical protein
MGVALEQIASIRQVKYPADIAVSANKKLMQTSDQRAATYLYAGDASNSLTGVHI